MTTPHMNLGKAATGSLVTAGVAARAITDIGTSYAAGASTPLVNGYVEHSVLYSSSGTRIKINWGGFAIASGAGPDVILFLYYRKDDGADVDHILAQGLTLYPTATLSPNGIDTYFWDTPPAGDLIFSLVTQVTGTAYLWNGRLSVEEVKR